MDNISKIHDLMAELQKQEIHLSKLSWTQYTTGYDFGIDKAYDDMNQFLKNKDHFTLVKEHMNLHLNDEDKRRMQLVYRTFEDYHQSDEVNVLNEKIQNQTTDLSKILNTFRFKIDGKEITSVELAQILQSNPDREMRKKAFLARNQINQPLVDAGFLTLVEMRKELASLTGYNTFIDYQLEKDDLDRSIFEDWTKQVNELLPQMNEMRKKYAQKYLHDDTLYPWDESFVQNQIAPSLAKPVDMMDFYRVLQTFFTKFGFNLDDYNITYDVFSRANKSEWGYNFPVETAVDSRILANVKNRFSEYEVLLHETGHGLHSFLLDPEKPILNNGVSGIICEGIANLFGSFAYDEFFYSQFFDADLEQAKQEFKELKAYTKMNSLRAVAGILFDQAFYTTENKTLEDITAMYWDIQKSVLGVEKSDYQPPWGFRIHHTTHPIYLHNYFMGDVTCEMLKAVFKEDHHVAEVTEKAVEFGQFILDQVVNPTGRYAYGELFEKISGNKFSLSYLL
jgi:oligoendopeptidase F